MDGQTLALLIVAGALLASIAGTVLIVGSLVRGQGEQTRALLIEVQRQQTSTFEHMQRTALVGGTPRDLAERKFALDEAVNRLAIQEKEMALEEARQEAQTRALERGVRRAQATAPTFAGARARPTPGIPINPGA